MVNEYSEEPATALLIRNDTDFRMMQKLLPLDDKAKNTFSAL